MGFAKETKIQILKSSLENDCCGLAFLSGLINASGKFIYQNENDNIQKIIISTEIVEIFEFIKKITLQMYGKSPLIKNNFNKKSNQINFKKNYQIVFPQSLVNEIKSDIGLIDETKNLKIYNIDEYLIKDICCKKSYIKGVFVGCATSGINLKQKSNSLFESFKSHDRTEYNVEFISASYNFLLQFSNLLAEFNIFPRLIQRKSHYVLYLKESGAVSDLLALVEAYDSVLQLQSELAVRELRNKVNRQTNCLNANISKTVEASMKQLEAIDNIANTIGIDALPSELQSIALLRVANPEESLSELLKLLPFKITKSVLNNRLNKIIKIANDL